jgi:hypothetical protein
LALSGILGVASESIGAPIEVMLLPSLVLAFFVAELTPSYTTIGLVPAIAVAFWTMARIPAALMTANRRRKQPWAFGAAVARAGAIVILAVVTLRTDPTSLGVSARPLLGTLFLCLIVYALAGGFGSVPHHALLRSTASNEAWSTFLTRRAVWSAALAVLAGLIVSRLLGSDALLFPSNYGRLFLAAAVLLIAGAVFTAVQREPASGPLFAEPAIAPRAWRQPLADARFRRLLLFRVLLAGTAAIDPFLFLYAVTRLGVPMTTIGSYALAAVLGWVMSAPLWYWLDRRSGPRGVLQSAAVVRLVAPAMALVVPQIASSDPLRTRLGDVEVLTAVYGIAFFAIGASLAALSRGGYTYLAIVTPRQMLRPAIALSNVVLAVLAFAPVVGGAIIQSYGYEALFGAAAALGLVAVFAGGRLADAPSVAWEGAQPDRGSRAFRALQTGPM